MHILVNILVNSFNRTVTSFLETSKYCNFVMNEHNEKINYLLVRDSGLFDKVFRRIMPAG